MAARSSTPSRVAGGLGITGGLGAYALGKTLENQDSKAKVLSMGQRMLDPRIYNDYEDTVDHIKTGGLVAAGTIGAALAGHKLYKMYKNRKKENHNDSSK